MHQMKLALTAAFLTAGIAAGCASVPSGRTGEGAVKIAKKMRQFAGLEKWRNDTAAVSFVFSARDNQHFWDKKRGFVEVAWDDYTVQFNNKGKGLLVWDGDKRVTDKKKLGQLRAEANSRFVNDTFWLNPVFHIDSPGTVKKEVDGGKLLVEFTSGGVTPGDSYLFTVDDSGKILELEMWVSIAPVKFIPGMSFDFESYITTETGVRLATEHTWSFINVKLEGVKMYGQYPVPGTKDRFAALAKQAGGKDSAQSKGKGKENGKGKGKG